MKISGIELNSFTKIYDTPSGGVKACDNVDFFAPCGKITGLLGLNGAGKSTLLKAMCGIHYATEGLVNVFGETKSDRIKAVVGFSGEQPLFDKNLTVCELLYEKCRLSGLSHKDAVLSVKNAALKVNISDMLFVRIGQLSKGYLQRVSIARAVCTPCKALVLDEFSDGLDPAQIMSMKSAIKSFSKDKAVVFSTHHIDEAVALCDFIYIIHKGKIAASGTVDQIIKSASAETLEDAFIRLTSQ